MTGDFIDQELARQTEAAENTTAIRSAIATLVQQNAALKRSIVIRSWVMMGGLLLLILLLLGHWIWLTLHLSAKTPDALPGVTAAPPKATPPGAGIPPTSTLHIAHFKSGAFSSSSRNCEPQDTVCTQWTDQDSNSTSRIDFTSVLKSTHQPPNFIILEGGHDTQPFKSSHQDILDNEDLALHRAERIRDLLVQTPTVAFPPSNIMITIRPPSVRTSASPVDRTVRITLITMSDGASP